MHVIKGTYDGSSDGEIDLARGGVITYLQATLTFQTNGILHVKNKYNNDFNDGYELKLWLSGYHYPTIAELLTETQTAQDDADALNLDQDYRLTLLELGVTDDETTETA